MAMIYKKKTKKGIRWGFRVYMGTDPITGKDFRKSKEGFLTQKDAKIAAALFERQIYKGEYIEPTRVTFSEIYSDWERHYLIDAKESSLRARKIALKHMIKQFGDIPIQKITRKSYQDVIDNLSLQYSSNYISSIHTSANMVFEYAFSLKILEELPTKNVKLPKKKITVTELENNNKINDKFLEKHELEEFLTVTKEKGLEGDLLAFTLLAYTGMRIGEMLALKWSDLNIKDQTIRIIRTYYNPTNNKVKYQLLTPKTEGSIRTITIDPLLIILLEKHKEEQNIIKLENKHFYVNNDFIFATNEGYPKTIKHYSIRLQRILKQTNTKKHITPHSFRHTHTSLLIEANVHIKEIQERLGHSDIKTTMDIYAHMTQNLKRDASNKFNKLLNNLSSLLIN